ncbi:hypothetical protein Glove_199g154 [Diversispora epigaea]|uniref:Uncharacterized protein n=1 Tax=Diversispora epigaea TaxID=1348612 RepID=A0A397ITJ7_9GLOM|nr:hypothetical protein Glove_199g154 [Diversispora epigaea]
MGETFISEYQSRSHYVNHRKNVQFNFTITPQEEIALQEIIKNRENNLNNNDEMLNFEFECLREIMRAIIQYPLKSTIVESADEVYELLSQEVSRLQELYVKCAANGCWKDKMIEFEKKGIRPTSFFQSSFQLLEEENEENLVINNNKIDIREFTLSKEEKQYSMNPRLQNQFQKG